MHCIGQRIIREAEKGFTELNEVENKTLAQKSTYNKGVLYSREKKLLESIETYKRALILIPQMRMPGSIFKKHWKS